MFQQMAGKIVDFPWDASTGLACCRLAVLCMCGVWHNVPCVLLTWQRSQSCAAPQDFVTALPDLRAVMLQAYLSASPSSLICCATAGEDFVYPATEGVRPEKSWVEKQVGAYIADLLEMAPGDAAVFAALMPVRSMLMMCRRIDPRIIS